MSLKIPSPTGLAPDIERALDEIIAPIQAYADRELGGTGWVSLDKTDLQGVRGDSGVTFTLTETLSNSATRGHIKFLRLGRAVLVSFNVAVTPSAVTGQIDVLLPQFGVVGRSHNVCYDSSGNAVSITLGTPLETLGSTLIPATTSVLHFEKLNGADFPASAFGLIGQVWAEVSELETFVAPVLGS